VIYVYELNFTSFLLGDNSKIRLPATKLVLISELHKYSSHIIMPYLLLLHHVTVTLKGIFITNSQQLDTHETAYIPTVIEEQNFFYFSCILNYH